MAGLGDLAWIGAVKWALVEISVLGFRSYGLIWLGEA